MDLDQAIKYLSDRSEPTNKLHWGLIGFGLFWYLIAITTTFILINQSTAIERDPFAAKAFEYFGMVPTFLIMLVLITVTMVYIPYKFRENKRIGLLCNVAFIIFFILDGGHNAAILAGDNMILNIPYNITENIMMCLGL